MKRRIIICLTGLVAAAGIASLWFVHSLPGRIVSGVKAALSNAGFEHIAIQNITYEGGKIVLEGITLDAESFSNIKSATIHYSALSYLQSGLIDAIEIASPVITASINREGIWSISGYEFRPDIHPATMMGTIAQRVNIQSGRLDLLSARFGGFSIDFDAQIRHTDDARKVAIKGALASAQHQLKAQSRLDGYVEIGKNWPWHMEISFEDARLRIPGLESTRLSGTLNADGNLQDGYRIEAELNAGGLKTGRLAWHNVAAQFERDNDQTGFFVTGNAIDHDDMEFSMTYASAAGPVMTGTIFAPSLKHLEEYCDRYDVTFINMAPQDAPPSPDGFLIEYSIPLNEFLRIDSVSPAIGIMVGKDFYQTRKINVVLGKTIGSGP